MTLRRRSVLAGLAASAAATGCERHGTQEPPALEFVGQSPGRGHLLRGPPPTAPVGEQLETNTLIVGSGAAGTAAAWRLHHAGMHDFLAFEMEDHPGGTAASGQSPRTRYPLGAHYLPSPHPDFALLRSLLRELDVEIGSDAAGRPLFDPSRICRAPVERHRYKGQWFSGLYPELGQSAEEEAQWTRWWEHLRALERERGSDGRRLFELPLERSSTAKRELTNTTMADYLRAHGFDGWRLRWAIDYACRDDYGTSIDHVSAFAGLHHYLARGLEATHDRVTLMWPGGNGELVEAMAHAADLTPRRRGGMVVFDIDPHAGIVHAWDTRAQHIVRVQAKAVLWAAPRFVLPYVLRSDPLSSGALSYAPWLVANVHLDRRPAGVGVPLAWDNVMIEGEHLGYVVSTHGESLVDAKTKSDTVITFYEALVETPERSVADARGELLSASLETLAERVTHSLEGMHPGIIPSIRRISIARWGHAMIRPVTGLLFGDALARAAAPIGLVQPCATDIGGVPLFEQAFCNGVTAADRVLAATGLRPPGPSLEDQ